MIITSIFTRTNIDVKLSNKNNFVKLLVIQNYYSIPQIYTLFFASTCDIVQECVVSDHEQFRRENSQIAM